MAPMRERYMKFHERDVGDASYTKELTRPDVRGFDTYND
jgi:hypothetical protein